LLTASESQSDLQVRSSICVTSAQHMQDMCHCSDLLQHEMSEEKNDEEESESASC